MEFHKTKPSAKATEVEEEEEEGRARTEQKVWEQTGQSIQGGER